MRGRHGMLPDGGCISRKSGGIMSSSDEVKKQVAVGPHSGPGGAETDVGPHSGPGGVEEDVDVTEVEVVEEG
jgi:hypothetical protein